MAQMTRYRDAETGEVVTARALHQRFAIGLWGVDPERTLTRPGEDPDEWVVVDEQGQERTLRRIEDAEDAEDDGQEADR